MVTPKTDIIQTAGRILRMKHQNPIIVDFVDKHDLFQKQWMQRFRYYKKCNYRVRKISSRDYTNMTIDWYKDTTWKKVFEPKTANKNDSGVVQHKRDADEVDEEDPEDSSRPKNGNVGSCLIHMVDGFDDM
jgi:hypothetical protein